MSGRRFLDETDIDERRSSAQHKHATSPFMWPNESNHGYTGNITVQWELQKLTIN